ncbi:MAG: chorismate mutase, partial [Rikenellaceae bacterium]|nr:chorismate mutase [Rikenellaceae bacterium]
MNQDLITQIGEQSGTTRVAIQGFEGCFHQIAAHATLGSEIEIVPCATFREVAAKITSGEAEMGVMAIENSIAGSILQNYNILQHSGLKVIGETYLLIRQHLMVNPGVALDDVREVSSNPMALLQCADYLDTRSWRLVETEDTAQSARHLAESGTRDAAAVAGDLAAELF